MNYVFAPAQGLFLTQIGIKAELIYFVLMLHHSMTKCDYELCVSMPKIFILVC